MPRPNRFLNPVRRLNCRLKYMSDELLALSEREYGDAVWDVMDVEKQDIYGHLTKDDDYTWKQSSGRSLYLLCGGQEVEVDFLHEVQQFILKPAAGERTELLWLAQVDYTRNHSNGRRLNLPGQGQQVEDGSRGKLLASNVRFVNESNRVLGSRPKIWAPTQDVVNQDGYVGLTKDDDYTWKQSSGRSLNLPGGGQEVEVDSLHEFLQSGRCFILKLVRERNKLLWLTQVDCTWTHSNGRRLNLPGQGQEVEDGSRGKFLASNVRFVNESDRVLGSRPKIWAPNQDKTIKTQENSNADANISCFTCIQTVVLVSSSLMLCAVPWFLNTKKKAINGVASDINNSWLLWPRNMIMWIDIALMVAAPASLLALEMKASKPLFARLSGIIATLCLLFAVVLQLSTLISLVSSVTI